jgi:hypothetical protein
MECFNPVAPIFDYRSSLGILIDDHSDEMNSADAGSLIPTSTEEGVSFG